jgi:alpha-tubulin suppressor-like RCC1 family protein
VKCWGNNGYGQLGLSDTTSPQTVPGVTGISQLVAGRYHTCALETGGTVKCWGFYNTSPQSPTGLIGIRQLVAGNDHTCALEIAGTVKCWGGNDLGQLGLGNTTDGTTPQTVPGLTGIRQLDASGWHTCARETGGTLLCWGRNDLGQRGFDPTYERSLPQTVPGLPGMRQLVAGINNACALENGGTVKCWGSNNYGQLGLGDTINNTSPQTVTGLTGINQLVAGIDNTCALETGGTVKCWGRNSSGQLGLGDLTNRTSPQTVPDLTGISQLVAGSEHTCALETGGTVKCWGSNSSGQLGLGDNTNRTLPETVTGLVGIRLLAAAGAHTCALETGGSVKCWGRNDAGQIGLDVAGSVRAPGPQVICPSCNNFAPGRNVLPGSVQTSAPLTIRGINAPSTISVTGGSYAIGCTGAFVSTAGTISNNQTVCVRHTAAARFSQTTTTTVTIGGVSARFNSTTLADPVIHDPHGDYDGDGIPNRIEREQGRNPLVKDNEIFADTALGRRLYVEQVYRDVLVREADAAGLAFWLNQLESGSVSRANMISSVLVYTHEATLAARLYFAIFQRSPDPVGHESWTWQISNRGAALTAEQLIGLNEFFSATLRDSAGYIDRLYRHVLGRPADSSGAAYWQSQMNPTTNFPRGEILLRFANSAEYRTKIDADVAVARLYIAMLRRQPEDAALAFWANRLKAGGTLDQLIDDFLKNDPHLGPSLLAVPGVLPAPRQLRR